MANKHIDIKFPISENPLGYYFDSNYTTKDSIMSGIMHVLVTKKGERFYYPQFGTSLYTFIFENQDNITISDIINEANYSLKFCLPTITIKNIEVVSQENNRVNLKVTAINTDDVFYEQILLDVTI